MPFAENGLAHFHRALEIYPNFHYTEIEIASLYVGRGAFDKARNWYDKAIASAPTYTPAYVFAARMERQCGSHRTALDLLERAWQVDPGNVDVTLEIVDG